MHKLPCFTWKLPGDLVLGAAVNIWLGLPVHVPALTLDPETYTDMEYSSALDR
jgi:hypothetical protein